MKYLFIILIFATLFSSCTSKYPTGWPTKIGADNFICKIISGKYSNPSNLATEQFYQFGKRANPTIECFMGNIRDVSPSYFKISFTEKSELKFELYDETQKKYDEYIFIKDKEYKCKNDHVYLKGPDMYILDEISGGGNSYYANHLYLGEDGSLIVYTIEKTNIIGNFIIWTHFKRISE